MFESNDKISSRQAVLLFVIAVYSPAIRLFPQYAARTAGKAGWLSPLVAILPIIFLVLVMQSFFKNYPNENLSDLFFRILGNVLGRIVVSLYLVLILVLLASYVRYYAERLLASMLPNTSISFLIFVMLALVFFATRKGLVTMARANEVFVPLLISIFAIVFLLSLPQIKYSNLMNVTYLDAWPVVKSSLDLYAIWGYFVFIFFFADKISNPEKIKKHGLQGIWLVFVFNILLLIMTIGSLGSRLANHVSLPFFSVVKNISLLETINRFESFILSVWGVTDFIIIAFFTMVAVSIIKSLFKVSDTKAFVCPVVLFAGIASMFLFQSFFEIEVFSAHIALQVNVVFELLIPFAVFGIGKIRKII